MLTKNNKNKGFTIIELLIVLSIAGFILLVVLMAIPTLQRNGRNNQRNQDIQAILSALSQYELNNSGNFPSSNGDYLQYTKLSFYDQTNTDITTSTKNSGEIVTNDTSLSTVQVHNHQKCDPDNPGQSTWRGAGFNDVVALFSIETSHGSAVRCKDI